MTGDLDSYDIRADNAYDDLQIAAKTMLDIDGKIIVKKNGAHAKMYAYDGKKFVEDHTGLDNAVMTTLVNIAKMEKASSFTRMNSAKDDPKRKAEIEAAYNRVKRMLLSANKIGGVARLTATLLTREVEFDRDQNLLNTKNKVVNLKYAEIGMIDALDHKPSQLLSMMMPVRYDPEAQAPEFWALMCHMFPDGATRDYVLKVMASAMFRKRFDELVFIIHGIRADNGKTTLFEAITGVLGTGDAGYSVWMNPKAFSTKQTSNSTQPALKQAIGKALAIIDEPERDEIDIGMEKQASNTGLMSLRGLYEAQQSVRWTATLIHLCNRLPNMDLKDAGTMRRIVVIPVETQITEAMKNAPRTYTKGRFERYGTYLAMNEGDGILNLLLGAFKEYAQNGYKLPPMPAVVREATDDYIRRSNPVAMMVHDLCTKDAYPDAPDYKPYVSAGKFHEAFESYCTHTLRQSHVMQAKNIAEAMEALGYKYGIIKDARNDRKPERGYDGIRFIGATLKSQGYDPVRRSVEGK